MTAAALSEEIGRYEPAVHVPNRDARLSPVEDFEAGVAGGCLALVERESWPLKAVAVVGDRIHGLERAPGSLIGCELLVVESDVSPREVEGAEAVPSVGA